MIAAPTSIALIAPRRTLHALTLLLLVLFAVLSPAQAQQDNRIKPGIKVGDPIPDDVPEVLLTTAELRAKIASFQNADLTRAVSPFMALKWQHHIALRDADYILCLFDASAHSEPGNNPRVLLLLTTDYRYQTWGSFTCEPFFEYGRIVSPLHQPYTYFVTVNPSGRSGGTLYFEKYLINATGILKLGEGYELTKIPDLVK